MPVLEKFFSYSARWLFLLTVGFLFLVVWGASEAGAARAVVTGDVLNVREGPGKDHSIKGKVDEGDSLNVLEKSEDWYKVQLNNNGSGWVAGEFVKLENTVSSGSKVKVTAGVLNIRNKPGTDAERTGRLNKGDNLTVTETSRGWCKVELQNGNTGWVAGWHLSKSEIEEKEPSNQTGIVTADILNIRSGPGKENSIVGKIQEGERISVKKSSGDWYEIEDNGGRSGWVTGDYIKMQENTSLEAESAAAGRKNKFAVVSADVLNVRQNPGENSQRIGQVKQGDRLAILDSSRGWCKVELPGGGSGWIAGWHIEVHEETVQRGNRQAVQAIVDATNVNVREGPGTDNEIVAQVDRGERMGVLEKVGEWYKVDLGEGVIGWIADWLIDIDEAGATTPRQKEQHRQEAEESEGGGEDDIDWENFDSNLDKLKVKEESGRTKMTIATTGPVAEDIFTLDEPSRVIIDLKGVKANNLPEKINVDSNLVKEVAASQENTSPVIRLEVGVKEKAMFNASKDDIDGGGTELTVEFYVPDLKKDLNGKVIALDPGHGGKDDGARGPSGLKEKNVNIDVALLTAHLLRENGAEVVLTRASDKFVELEERTEIASKKNADIFVSIHMNSHPLDFKSGTSTFYRQESDAGYGVSQEKNKILARQIQSQLIQSLNRDNRGVKQANFVVLRSAEMPAALVEASFISNSREENLLKKDSYRSQIAGAITQGISNYFESF